MNLKSVLDSIPLNGYKTWVGVLLTALVVGLIQLGYLDQNTGTLILDAVVAWTGVALLHKELKAEPSPPSS